MNYDPDIIAEVVNHATRKWAQMPFKSYVNFFESILYLKIFRNSTIQQRKSNKINVDRFALLIR